MHTQTAPASSPSTVIGTPAPSSSLPCAHVYGVQFSTVVCTVCGESASVIRAREGAQPGAGSWDVIVDVMAPASPAPVFLPSLAPTFDDGLTLMSPVELHALAVSSLHPLPTAPLVSRRPASQWLAYAAGAVGVAVMTVIVAVTLAVHGPALAASATLPACATEDSSTACYWDADTRGNGEGRSFTVTDDGTVHYR